MSKVGLIIILILALAGGVAYFLISSGKISNPLNKSTQTNSLGGQIYSKTQNPVSKLPETNPFNKVNPFKGVYKNPFQ